MNKRIVYSISLFTIDVTYDIIEKWIKIAGSYFEPQRMSINQGGTRKYNEKKMYENIKKELQNGVQLRLSDEDNSFWISYNAQSAHITSMTMILEDAKELFLDRAIDELMVEKGIVASKCSLEDDTLQNLEDVDLYKWKGGNMWGVKTKYSKTFNRKVIDTEYNPGHSHRPNGIWFGARYMMWFGRPYYQYIEKGKLKSFRNCYENVELDNEVIRIRLYENLWDYDKKESRKIQWDFRRSVGIDIVAHQLEESEAKTPRTNAAIEIFMGNFPNGGTRLTKSYFDDQDNNVTKDKAAKVRICEFSEKGELLASEEKRLE